MRNCAGSYVGRCLSAFVCQVLECGRIARRFVSISSRRSASVSSDWDIVWYCYRGGRDAGEHWHSGPGADESAHGWRKSDQSLSRANPVWDGCRTKHRCRRGRVKKASVFHTFFIRKRQGRYCDFRYQIWSTGQVIRFGSQTIRLKSGARR